MDELAQVVSPAILQRAARVSRLLTKLGVPHALIGGLAVGVHGHPRAAKDVDFLVGPEAFERTSPFAVYREELKEIARVGDRDPNETRPRARAPLELCCDTTQLAGPAVLFA